MRVEHPREDRRRFVLTSGYWPAQSSLEDWAEHKNNLLRGRPVPRRFRTYVPTKKVFLCWHSLIDYYNGKHTPAEFVYPPGGEGQ